MVKAQQRQIDAAVRALDAKIRAALVFGPDEGLVRERADLIARQIVDAPGDPFNSVTLKAEQVKAESGRLGDELAAMSMMGGRRLVRVEGAVDGIRTAIEAALDGPASDNFLLIVGGELPARSSLRRFAEKAPEVLAIACYADSAADLEGLIRETVQQAGLTIGSDAVAYLLDVLGADRQITRRELEKLLLYKGDSKADDTSITLEDARAVIGDGSSATVFEIAAAVTAGRVSALDRLLDRAFLAGESPVALLRILARRLQQMHLVRGHMAQGLDRARAVDKLTPRLFYRDRDRFLAELDQWPLSGLNAALARVLEAEADCKTTGMPDRAVCSRLCLQLAAFARRRKAGRDG